MKLRAFAHAGAAALAFAVLGVGAAGAAEKADVNIGASLASDLVQSKTAARLLQSEDKVDRACQGKKVVNAVVVETPSMVQVSEKVAEKRWQEQWTVDRCGTQVGYRVFYTEIGIGGTFFSYTPHQQR